MLNLSDIIFLWTAPHMRVVFSQTRHFTVIAFTDANMYATSMMQHNVLKVTVPDRMVWLRNLPVLLLLCAWARHLKTRTQRSQAICTSLLPASKSPVNTKSIILTPCTSTQRKRTKKELPDSYTKLLNYRHRIVGFLQKLNEDLVQIKVTITNHDVGPNYTLN